MNQVYVAHDSAVGDGATLASSVLLAGHVRIGAGANLGLGTAVHQFRSVGRGGDGRNVLGDHARCAGGLRRPTVHPRGSGGANTIGMERSGQDPALITLLAAAYVGEDVDVEAIGDLDLRSEVREWISQERAG